MISNIKIPPYVGEFQLIDKKIYKELLNFDDYPYTKRINCIFIVKFKRS